MKAFTTFQHFVFLAVGVNIDFDATKRFERDCKSHRPAIGIGWLGCKRDSMWKEKSNPTSRNIRP